MREPGPKKASCLSPSKEPSLPRRSKGVARRFGGERRTSHTPCGLGLNQGFFSPLNPFVTSLTAVAFVTQYFLVPISSCMNDSTAALPSWTRLWISCPWVSCRVLSAALEMVGLKEQEMFYKTSSCCEEPFHLLAVLKQMQIWAHVSHIN